MSRSGYSEDCENLELYRAAVRRASRGKRGKAFFKRLVEALEALPVKELEARILVTQPAEGNPDKPYECCAMGAVLLTEVDEEHPLAEVLKSARGGEEPPPRKEWQEDDVEFENATIDALARHLNIAPSLAREVAFENDETQYYRGGDAETPAQRYDRMLRWAKNAVENGIPY